MDSVPNMSIGTNVRPLQEAIEAVEDLDRLITILPTVTDPTAQIRILTAITHCRGLIETARLYGELSTAVVR
jgi:hypothetical protein